MSVQRLQCRLMTSCPLSDQAWELLCSRLFQIEKEVGDRFPHVTENLVWRTSRSGEWTGGFYPGNAVAG